MSVRNLGAIFQPRSVALIGASRREGSVGHVTLRNLLGGGFGGPIWPVNPHAAELLGARVYPDIAGLPGAPDLAIVATPPEGVAETVRDLAARGTRGIVVLSAGFAELGAVGQAHQAEMLAAARPSLTRIVGPNGLGILVPRHGLNASFAHLKPKPGGLALIAQSGAIITSLLDWAHPRGLGFSIIASLGGMADVDFGDMLDYIAQNDETRAVLLYVEQVTQARKFLSAARSLSRVKPVIVVKAGRSAQGAKAAASHTGALAGSDDVYDAAFERGGMIRVFSLEELFDAAETLARVPALQGERLAIITNGGGIGVLATDAAAAEGARLATLSPPTIDALNLVLPATWSHANPIDIIGDAGPERYAAAVSCLLESGDADALLVFNCPTAIADSLEAAKAVAAAAKTSPIPILTSWVGAETAEKSRAYLTGEGLATYDTPEDAVRAFGHVVRRRRNQALLQEVPQLVATVPAKARAQAQREVDRALGEGRAWLSEREAKRVLAVYGIPSVETRDAAAPAEAARIAQEFGAPVALKIRSRDLTHKSDVGGVALNLSPQDVARAAEEMLVRVRARANAAKIDGFSVEPMVDRPGAIELILGLATDPLFGPVIVFGQGGTAVEVVRDKAVTLPPLSEALARHLIARTRVWALLKGYRDRPSADEPAIISALLKLGEIAADIPEIQEIDINPLLADAAGVIALDARMRVAPAILRGASRFAIMPYPRELEHEIEDRRGTRYLLRPIKPEDAPKLEELIARSDPADLRMRFLRAVKASGELAARLSQIDYDREMCLTACDGSGAIVGTVRLYADPDRERAEFSVFVRTDRKGNGLGYRLMEEIIAYARRIGVREIFGEVLGTNERMLTMCREFGFAPHAVAGDAAIVEMRRPVDQKPTSDATAT
jgi:acetyltransferase